MYLLPLIRYSAKVSTAFLPLFQTYSLLFQFFSLISILVPFFTNVSTSKFSSLVVTYHSLFSDDYWRPAARQHLKKLGRRAFAPLNTQRFSHNMKWKTSPSQNMTITAICNTLQTVTSDCQRKNARALPTTGHRSWMWEGLRRPSTPSSKTNRSINRFGTLYVLSMTVQQSRETPSASRVASLQ